MDNESLVYVAIGCIVLLPVLAIGLRNPIVFFYFAIASTAFLKTPELPIVREKLALPEFGFVLTWLFWANIPKHRIAHPSLPPMTQIGGFFGLICLVSSAVGVMGSTRTGQPYSGTMVAYSFLESINYIYGVMIVWTTINLLDSWPRWLNAILAWMIGLAVASIVGVAAFGGLAPDWAVEETGRICSTLKRENQVPSMILPIILVVLLCSVRKGMALPWRVVFLGLTMAALIATIGSGSRTALLMIMCAAMALYWISATSLGASDLIDLKLLSMLTLVFSAVVGLYFCVAWIMYDGNYSLFGTPSWQRPAVLIIEWAQGTRELDHSRPRQIMGALAYFWNSPIIGTGPKLGAMLAATGGEIHNTYFSLLLETGVLGVGSFLLLIFSAVSRSSQAVNVCRFRWYSILARCLLVGLVLLAIYNSTMLGLRQRNIWILIGLLYAFSDLAVSVAPEASEDSAELPESLLPLYRGN